jgi:Flp pilus assembly protein TadG
MRNGKALNRFAKKQSRRGTVTVEFAFIIPVFLVILLGMTEGSRLLEIQNALATAAREGARLAAMDRNEITNPGQTTNQKITADVQNFLVSTGLPGGDLDIRIAEVNDANTTFDLDDPANDLRLFQLHVAVPLSAISTFQIPGADQYTVGAKVVFRNGRAPRS